MYAKLRSRTLARRFDSLNNRYGKSKLRVNAWAPGGNSESMLVSHSSEARTQNPSMPSVGDKPRSSTIATLPRNLDKFHAKTLGLTSDDGIFNTPPSPVPTSTKNPSPLSRNPSKRNRQPKI